MRAFISVLFFLLIPRAVCSVMIVTEERPPYTSVSPSGHISGAATERVRKLMKAADIDYQLKVYPWARAYNTALSRSNTLIYPILKTAQRSSKFYWYCPLMQGLPIYLFRLKERQDIQIQDLNDAKGLLVGVSRQDWNEIFLRQHGFTEGVNLDVSTDENANLLQLLAGRVDMVLVTEISVVERLRKLNLSRDIIEKALNTDFKESTPLCLALNTESDVETKQRLDTAFEYYLKNSGYNREQ